MPTLFCQKLWLRNRDDGGIQFQDNKGSLKTCEKREKEREEEILDGFDRKKSKEKEADGMTDTENGSTRKVRRECLRMCALICV